MAMMIKMVLGFGFVFGFGFRGDASSIGDGFG